MARRYWTQFRKRLCGSALIVLGTVLWAAAATLPLTGRSERDMSISYFEERCLGVIAGGASVVGGIILLATAV